MATVNVYLTFRGNCKQAFEFYRSVFGGDFTSYSTFDEMPPMEGMPSLSDEMKDAVMHVSLPISSETALMGSDTGGEWGNDLVEGNNFSISVDAGSMEETDRIFQSLGKGGKITMPLDKTFWNSYFGMLTNRFGINWMVSCNLPEHKSNNP